MKILPRVDRITTNIIELSEFRSDDDEGHTRISFTNEDLRARDYIKRLMKQEANLAVRVDAAGNIIGHRQGKTAAPGIMIGSHIDTVKGGGRFDGIAGVIAGVEIARIFNETHVKTVHPLEVIVFTAEEPSPFGISTVGSRAMAGKLSVDLLTNLKDSDGRTLASAIQLLGGDPANISSAQKVSEDIMAYVELHIEQGPSLFKQQIPVGIVNGIVGIYRGKLEINGQMDHAGTTPMHIRKDALTAAAEVILAIETICRETDDLVGTVGRIDAFPNSLNVVPGSVACGMEIRTLKTSRAQHAISRIEKAIDDIVSRRKVQIHFEIELSSKPVEFEQAMIARIRETCQRLDIPYLELPSGAGHDASHMAEIAPTGMIFIPSRDGRSHCPEEWSEYEHICIGTQLLAELVLAIDQEEKI